MKFVAVVSTALIASASAFAPSASTEVCYHGVLVRLGLSPWSIGDSRSFVMRIWALGYTLEGSPSEMLRGKLLVVAFSIPNLSL